MSDRRAAGAGMFQRIRGGAVGLATLTLAAVPLVGCIGGTPAVAQSPRGLVLTLIPAAAAFDVDPGAMPAARYPHGSRVVWLGPDGGATRVLSAGMATAGAPAVSARGESVAFAARRSDEARWQIFEMSLGEDEPRLVFDAPWDCIEPAYLAGDRLVVSCMPAASGPVADHPWALYTVGLDGSGLERISFGPTAARGPEALLDGRILFSAPRNWDGTGDAELFTVNPDGTLLESFTDDHSRARALARGREAADGTVFALVRAPGRGVGVLMLDGGSPATGDALRLGPPPVVAADQTGIVTSAEPGAAGDLVVAAFAPVGARSEPVAGLYRWRDGEWTSLDQAFEGAVAIEAVPVLARPGPRSRPRTVDPGADGFVLCYDTTRGDGVIGPAAADPRPHTVQVIAAAQGPAHGSAGPPDLPAGLARALMERPPASRGGVSAGAPLGQAAVQTDGSFFLQVPPDIPLRVATVSADGTPSRSSGWFWVRPGEVRACFGCHESRAAAPVNRAVLAIQSAPAIPAPVAHETAPRSGQ